MPSNCRIDVTPRYRCWAEVDLEALRGNLAWIRHRVGPKVKIMTVVKADAYGHGLKPIAALLMQSGTDIFGVANLVEARAIRSVGQGWPILMLGACLAEEIEGAVKEKVMPTISSLPEAEAFSAMAKQLRSTVDVHVKVDTGMGRLGVRPDAAIELIEGIQKLSNLRLHGLYTHFSSAEDDPQFSQRQANSFRTLLRKLARRGIHIPCIHANNSAALLYERDTTFNVVRPGLLVYGIVPPGQRTVADPLFPNQIQPALAWKCRVSFLKEVPRGTPLSYGRAYVAPRKSRVATITVGYGDGYPRAGSNHAQVLVGGVRCRVLGLVTMDQTMIDVSAVRQVNTGDEVVLVGRQGNDQVTINELAAWCGTVPWEILTGITYRVPRLYRGGHAA